MEPTRLVHPNRFAREGKLVATGGSGCWARRAAPEATDRCHPGGSRACRRSSWGRAPSWRRSGFEATRTESRPPQPSPWGRRSGRSSGGWIARSGLLVFGEFASSWTPSEMSCSTSRILVEGRSLPLLIVSSLSLDLIHVTTVGSCRKLLAGQSFLRCLSLSRRVVVLVSSVALSSKRVPDLGPHPEP